MRPEGDVGKLGKIPNSYAVPITQVPEAFSEMTEEFKENYGFAKSRLDDSFCLLSKQGLGAKCSSSNCLKKNNWFYLRVFDGSFKEWQQKKGTDTSGRLKAQTCFGGGLSTMAIYVNNIF